MFGWYLDVGAGSTKHAPKENFMNIVPSFNLLQETHEHDLDFRSVEKVLDANECAKIISMSKNIEPTESRVSWGDENENVRSTDLFWIYPEQENYWLFERVATAIANLNSEFFKFSLDGQLASFQLGRYRQGQGYDWHADLGKLAPRRKLSVSIQLSQPDTYEGGALQFFRTEKDVAEASRELGAMTVFPSFLLHRAGRVVSGERLSLVTWLEGPPFR